MSRVMDMTEGKPAKLMLAFAFPVILTNLGQQLYQIVDAAIVGRGIGVDALAAVGCTDWTIWMILWSMSVMTTGFSTLVSRFFGSKEYDRMNQSIFTSAILSGMIALILTVAGVIATRPLLIFMGTPSNILEDAVRYLSTMLAGTLIITAYNLAASILRALGDSKTPLVGMIIAAGLNIALDLLFVMAFSWGVFGAAFASVLAQLVAFLFCLRKIFQIQCVRMDRETMRWDGRLALEILGVGLPLALQYMIINFGGIILQSTINGQGSDFVAGYTAANKLYGLLECTAISLGAAYTTYTAQNYGAGNYRRIRVGVRVGMVLAVGSAIVLIVVLLPLHRILPQFFIRGGDVGSTESISVASAYLIRMILALPILNLVYVHRCALQAIGISSWSLISGIFETVTRVLFAKVLFYQWGVDVLFYSEPLSWLAAWLFVLVPYYFYQRTRIPCESKQHSKNEIFEKKLAESHEKN